MTEEQSKRQVPQNELDLALMTTDAVWGKPDVPEELKTKLSKFQEVRVKKEDGTFEIGYSKDSLWGLLAFYTRDMRLANLNPRQFEYAQHYLDLAGDCLHENLQSAFIIALSRAATVLELSQSRGGFLRKQLSTLRTESYTEQKEPEKRRFFGGKNKLNN